MPTGGGVLFSPEMALFSKAIADLPVSSGLMSSGYGRYGGYGGQYGYQDRAYASGDLTFRCNVDYRGYVTNVRIRRNDGYRG